MVHDGLSSRSPGPEAITGSGRYFDAGELLAAISESSYDAILGVTLSGEIVSWNPRAERLYGYAADQMLGHPLSSLAPASVQDELQAILARVTLGEASGPDESQRLTKDGRIVHVLSVVSPVRNRADRLAGAVIVDRDLTEQRQIQADLAARDRQQAVVADLGRHALTQVDLDALLAEAVAAVAATLEVEYCKVLELLPGEEALWLRADVGWQEGLVGNASVGAGTDSQAGYTLLSDEPVIVTDLRTETRFGGPPLLHEHGVVSGLSTIIRGRERPFGVLGAHTRARRDFTHDDALFLRAVANVLAAAIERQRMEDEAHEDRFHALVQQAADMVSIVDRDGSVSYVSPAVKAVLGYTPVELLGAPRGDLVHPDDQARSQANFAMALAEPGVRPSIEVRVRHKDGSWRWIEARLTNMLAEPAVAGIVVNSRDVTERKRAETEQARLLREAEDAEKTFRDLIEAGPDAMIVTDDEGRITLVNRQVEALFGYTPDELVGHLIEQLLPERYRDVHVRQRLEYSAAPRIREMGQGRDLYARRKDGREFPAEIRLSPVRENGELRVIASVRDITERVQIVERQRLLAEVSRKLADHLNVGGRVQLAADLTVPTFADVCAVDVLGDRGQPMEMGSAHVDPERAQWIRDLQHRYPIDSEEPYGRARVLGTGKPELVTDVTPATLQAIARDPEHFAAMQALQLTSWIIAPLIARGRALGIITFATTGERRRFSSDDAAFAEQMAGRIALLIDNARLLVSERAVRSEAETLAAERTTVLAHIADGVVVAAATGHVTYVNIAARRLLGLDEEERADWATVAFPPLVGTDGVSRTVEEFLALAGERSELATSTSWRVVRVDETEVHVTAVAVPVVSEEGERLGAVLTLHDVTAAEALQRQRDEFLTNISHDLRTPLAAIRASLGVVLANEPPDMPESLHRLLTNADGAAERMGNLVADLLELARLHAGDIPLRRDDVDVRQVARRVVRAIEPLIDKRGQRLAVDLPSHPIVAPVDIQHLERALLNLLDNACKHGRQGGKIAFRLEPRPGEAVFAVSDDGPGIDPAYQERIFERFALPLGDQRNHLPGTGLGLPIAQALIELHGGHIWFDSNPGAGTTFWIAVPVDARGAAGED
ncbi:MAG: PAS domain S-box protein [Chloroflexi bacterium]|nr:PAS domain S-box protein [Chloroflexota bacterium]